MTVDPSEHDDPGDTAAVLNGRFVLHLEEIEAQMASFDRVQDRLGQSGFVAAWCRSGTARQVDDKGSVERAYEQIVNDLVAAFDEVERAAAKADKVPRTELVRSDPGNWWSTAASMGFDVALADTKMGPGRWRRLAIFGFMAHEDVSHMTAWCDTRHLFQHAYAARTPERGLQTWDTMHALRAELASTVDNLVRFRDWVVSPP